MAKQKNKTSSSENFTPDIQMLTHKYSDYYENFVMYDAKEIVYPIYKVKVEYQITKELEIHPIIIGILKIINYLQTIKEKDRYKLLKEITQMDSDILDSILGDFNTRGYLKFDLLNNEIMLTNNGLEALKKEREKVKETAISYIAMDGVLGQILGIYKSSKDILLEHKSSKDAFEFKPNFKAMPRIKELDSEFSDEKTLRQVLVECLKGVDEDENKNYEIDEILSIEASKFFKKYFCLFYKNSQSDERLLVIDNKYEEDNEATRLFDKLIQEQAFSDNIDTKAKQYQKNKQKFEDITPEVIQKQLDEICLENGTTIQATEHKRYFKYILNNAKKEIYIQSPWIRNEILQIYKQDIQNALKRGIKITIKYGLKPRNRFDKVGIDEKSQEYFNSLDKKMFKLIKGHDHSKIIICDDDFMIIGSFNWLSYAGEKDAKEARGETSSINLNKNSIEKEKSKFIN
ncbi:phospholipase D-like domain-containing protein [Campylobacter curvus]|uniref:phospholipase D-like domain-containing protein n=1 Tax=Campylobacter curvus TaxID=200 RepID=UPI0032D56D3B